MKKFLAILIIGAAWYFAGMNRQPTVMAAAVCGVIFVVFSFILTRILKRRLSADLPDQQNVVYKNSEAPLIIHTHNKSRLPVNRYRLHILMRYKGEQDGTVRRLNGSAGSRVQDDTATLYFTAPYSGIITVSLLRLRVYDYFMIFSSSRKLRHIRRDFIILPIPQEMHLRMPPFGSYTNQPVAESNSDKPGDDHSEIRLVREYRNGDLTRHMHRNYSARTEKIWIKEYQKENDFIFDLFLDTSFDTPLTVEDKDAFYELLYSLLYNLMNYDVIINIRYYEKRSGGMQTYELNSKDDVNDFTVHFFRAEPFCTKEVFSSVCSVAPSDGVMLINSSLQWFFNGKHIYTFRKQTITQELSRRYFDLL